VSDELNEGNLGRFEDDVREARALAFSSISEPTLIRGAVDLSQIIEHGGDVF
jgi:hypothetical protein